ncbi:MAG: hypothetical protein KY460_07850 [Actinobacteria bacterium]|nr:hypothetical protein [Actinomycetota bacterium]
MQRDAQDQNVGRESSWLDEVHRAMQLPAPEGRAVLDEMIAQRRRRAAELRARADSIDTDPHQQGVVNLMAAWVDDSIALLERARAHLDARQARERTGPGARRRSPEIDDASRARLRGQPVSWAAVCEDRPNL